MTDNFVTSPNNLVTRLREASMSTRSAERTVCDEAADEIERLRAERDEARRGEYRENKHTPTWAELTAYWKARAEQLRDALHAIVCNTEPDAIRHRDYDHLAQNIHACARAALGEEK